MNLNAFLKSLTKKENYLKAKEEGLKPVWFEDEYFQKFVEFLDYIFTSSDGVTDVKAAILQLADIRIADNEERAQFLIKVDDIFRSEEITGFEVALKLLKEKFISRIFVRSLKRIVTHLEEGNIQKAGNTVQKISRLFSELSLPFQSVRSVTDITVHKEALSPVKKGILTGYASIDKATSGMKPGELVVVMSGFAEGKSTLLLNIAYNVFKQGFNVVYFSLEMPYVQVVRRLDSLVSGIPYRKIKEGTLSVDEKVSLKNIISKFTDYQNNFYIVDCPGADIEYLDAKLSTFPKVDLMVIDYLTLLEGKLYKTVWERVGDVTVKVRTLARKYCIPCLTAVQVRREAISNRKEFYEAHDIALAFSIMQHSDIVFSMKIDDPEVLEAAPICLLKCKFLKNRDGERTSFVLHANFETFKVEELKVEGS